MDIAQRLAGMTAGVYLGLDKVSLVTTLQPAVSVSFTGFEGDRHAGITRKSDSRTPQYPRGTEIRNDRQISIVSVEELAQIAAALGIPEIKAEWLGANLLIQGIYRLTLLPPMTRLSFAGGVVLAVQSENLPCVHPGKVIQDFYGRAGLQEKFPISAMHLRGLVACVEKPGTIRQGESVQVDVPRQSLYQAL